MLREINQILTAKEKRQATLIALTDLLVALLDIGFLALLLVLVNRYTRTAPAAALTGFFGVIARIPVLLFLALYLAKNGFAYAVAAYTHRFFASVSTRLSTEQLDAYFNGNAGNFHQTDASVFVRRISQQPVEFSTYILANAQAVLSQSLLALCTIAAILLYHPALFLVIFMLLLPPSLWMAWLFRDKLKAVRRGTKQAAEKALQFLNESLGGYVEANVFRKTGFFTSRYASEARQLNGHIARQQTLQALPARLLEAVAVCGFFLLAALPGTGGNHGVPDWFSLAVFLGAVYKIMPAMVKILNSSGQMKTYAFILPDLRPRSPHFPRQVPPAEHSTDRIGSVIVERLRFRHAAGKQELNVDFDLKEGTLIALTGRSGSGKTTLLQLMAGFLPPDRGTIHLRYARSGLLPAAPGAPGLVYLKQQPFLLHDTLRKNICLDELPAEPEKIRRLLRDCGLETFVAGHPDGLDQLITENGRNISGGQRQRIMLARALYHQPGLLLLDEPFSQLDEAAETEMMQLLRGIAATGVLIFIATHSLAAAAQCHSIISLDEPVYA